MTTLHLLSGGLDSVTLLHEMVDSGAKVHALLFDYRQRHRQELLLATHHAKQRNVPWTTVELPSLGGLTEQSWIVPNRNAIFLSVAVNVACQIQAERVTIGCNADDADYVPDCRADFIAAMNHAVRSAGYHVEIVAPYISTRKWEIGAKAKEMGIRSHEIWTCYAGGETPCGKCMACVKLEMAMQ